MIKNIKKISLIVFVLLFVLNYFKTIFDVKQEKKKLKNNNYQDNKVEDFNNNVTDIIEEENIEEKNIEEENIVDPELYERLNDEKYKI